jgi:hypothetical protein
LLGCSGWLPSLASSDMGLQMHATASSLFYF